MIILIRCCSMHILWSRINRTVTTHEVLESFSSSINSMLAMLDLTFSWRDLLTKHRSSSLSACACSSWQGLEASSVVFSFLKTRSWIQLFENQDFCQLKSQDVNSSCFHQKNRPLIGWTIWSFGGKHHLNSYSDSDLRKNWVRVQLTRQYQKVWNHP